MKSRIIFHKLFSPVQSIPFADASKRGLQLPPLFHVPQALLVVVHAVSQPGKGRDGAALQSPYRTQEHIHSEINPHEAQTSRVSASTVLIDPPRYPTGTWALKNVQLWRQFNIECLPQASPFFAAPSTSQTKGKSKRNASESLSHTKLDAEKGNLNSLLQRHLCRKWLLVQYVVCQWHPDL